MEFAAALRARKARFSMDSNPPMGRGKRGRAAIFIRPFSSGRCRLPRWIEQSLVRPAVDG